MDSDHPEPAEHYCPWVACSDISSAFHSSYHLFSVPLSITAFLLYSLVVGWLIDPAEVMWDICIAVLDEDDKPLVSVCPSDSLLYAIFHLSYSKVHRLLVVNPITGNALHVLTYLRILQFIHVCVC